MLKKFVEIDHKCFKQFKWGALPELARFNLFYGWNGTGKTTLSNLLADIDRKAPIEVGTVVFRLDDMNIHGDGIASAEHDLNLLAETPKVMQAILEVMRREDKEHVDRLEEVLHG